MRWMNAWRVSMVIPENVIQLILLWDRLQVRRALTAFWKLSFYCLLWTIWLYRNDVIFNNLLCNDKKIYEAAILRLGCWCKCKWPDPTYPITEFIRNPYLIASKAFRNIDLS
ncbi:hypothetical protein V6N13_016984 [Hibiscus sabdariffa]